MRKTDGRKFLEDLPEWKPGSWEGAEYCTLQKSAGITFKERLAWLQEASELADRLRKAPKKSLKDARL